MHLNRYQACGLHLLLSAFAVGCVALLIFFVWYPGLLAYASGVTSVFLILVMVDVILGPLITLIIFNPQKKELKRDLLTIACIQIAALFYGVFVFFNARPVFIVFNSDRFDVVYASELSSAALNRSRFNEFHHLPVFGPKYIAARLPSDLEKANQIVMSSVAGGDDVQQMPEYYLPYYDAKDDVLRAARSLDQWYEFNHEAREDVEQIISSLSVDGKQYAYLPLVGKVKTVSIVIDKSTADIILINRLLPFDQSYGVNAVDLKSTLKNLPNKN